MYFNYKFNQEKNELQGLYICFHVHNSKFGTLLKVNLKMSSLHLRDNLSNLQY